MPSPTASKAPPSTLSTTVEDLLPLLHKLEDVFRMRAARAHRAPSELLSEPRTDEGAQLARQESGQSAVSPTGLSLASLPSAGNLQSTTGVRPLLDVRRGRSELSRCLRAWLRREGHDFQEFLDRILQAEDYCPVVQDVAYSSSVVDLFAMLAQVRQQANVNSFES